MKNNPILEKNLACIARYNPELKYAIMQIKSFNNEFSFEETLLGETNLSYNGVLLHSNHGASAEAKEIFATIEDSPLSMHLLFGFGLGYLFEQFASNSKGLIFVYEPDIEILAATLEVADLSKELSKDNVFVFTNFEHFKNCYEEKFVYQSDTDILVLPPYKKLFPKQFEKFVHDMNFSMGTSIISNNYIKKNLKQAVFSLCGNIDLLVNEQPFSLYKNFYNGKTAVIVSAGPSLNKDLDAIKKYRDRVIIFCVGQAAKTLNDAGITPDYLVMIELANTLPQIRGIDLSKVNLIVEPFSYRGLHEIKCKNKISYTSKTSLANLIWAGFANIDPSEYESCGTVSYTALYSAMIMGFKKIILAGQDFAYSKGKLYSSNTAQNGMECVFDEKSGKHKIVVKDMDLLKESIFPKNAILSDEDKNKAIQRRLDYLNNSLMMVEGINGEKLPSSADYASFAVKFGEFALKNKDVAEFYNASLIGAKINGFEDVSIEDVLEKLEPIEFKENNVEYSYDINYIVQNILLEREILSDILKLISTSEVVMQNFDNEYQRRKILNEHCLIYFKQLMVLYLDLKEAFINKSRVFSLLQSPYDLEVSHIIRTSNKKTSSDIVNVYNALKVYLISVKTDLISVKSIIEKGLNSLNEMSNTKS